ncbi:hypothetical protein ACJIZ3_017748 [Penstemon smallii]|uniref:Uncharacterized protein n=1 Tax=Penstemon smallii TaxID=265156 RepID=A0ABD3SX08_9LAMI
MKLIDNTTYDEPEPIHFNLILDVFLNRNKLTVHQLVLMPTGIATIFSMNMFQCSVI